MSNVLVQESTLEEIANAIREKNKKTERYKPAEMPEAILGIKTNQSAPVRFYDYCGELIDSYTLEEVEAMTELPPLPQREGMICQGWNWTLESIKNAKRDVDVGAIYITDDGATRIYISLVEGALNPILGFSQMRSGSVWVDWGDESPLETSDVTGKDNPVNIAHQYDSPGDYVIRLIPEEDAEIYIAGDSKGTRLLRKLATSSSENYVYGSAIKKIEFGKGIAGLENYALTGYNLQFATIPNDVVSTKSVFNYCYGLEYIALPRTWKKIPSSMFSRCDGLKAVSIPDTITELASNCFSNCYQLQRITLPDSVENLWAYAMYYCESLEKIVIPKSLTIFNNSNFDHCASLKEIILHDDITKLGTNFLSNCMQLKKLELPKKLTKIENQMLMYCYSLQEIEIPDSVTEIGVNAFAYCSVLATMKIPENVVSIGYSAFSGCSGIGHYYFYPKIPPTLTNKNTFSGISATCKIHVPKGSLEAYQTADYWSEFADYMVEMEV